MVPLKVLVFGGSGFLGSHVADSLTSSGYEVTIFDLKPSTYLKNGQKMISADVLDTNAVTEAISGQDVVYNFAGIADLDDARTKPLDTVKLNVIGNINVMEACLAAGVKRFVYASTIYVYSQKGGFYRCSKQASEIYVEEFHKRFGLEYTVLRYGTLYGERATASNSIYRYLTQAMDEGKITCSGSGEEIREYINVKDAAALSVSILSEEYRNRHIIITGQHPMKYKEMIMMIKEILSKDIEIEFVEGNNPDHYNITPYSFVPKIGHKLVSNLYLDMGQGILECLHEIQEQRS